MIGLDTSAIIDFFRGDAHLQKVLEGLKEPLVANQMSYLELMFGLDFGNKKHKIEEEYYDAFFHSVSNLSLDAKASKRASEIAHTLQKEGKTVGAFDCAIAGIYLAHGVHRILTRNKKHFEPIQGLDVVSY